MKRLLLLGIFLFAISSGLAQDKLSLTFRDGSVRTGFGKFKGGGPYSKKGDKIVFKSAEDAEKEYFDYHTVKKLTLHEDDFDINYEYKIIDGTGGYGSVRLMRVLVDGEVALYSYFLGNVGPSGPTGFAGQTIDASGSYGTVTLDPIGGGFSATDFMSSDAYEYFLAQGDSDNVTRLKSVNTHSKRFKKIAEDFFSTCPDLVEKIQNNYFDKLEGLETIVAVYNENCSH